MNFKKQIAAYVNSGNISLYHAQRFAIVSRHENSKRFPRKTKKMIRKNLKRQWRGLFFLEELARDMMTFRNPENAAEILTNAIKDEKIMVARILG